MSASDIVLKELVDVSVLVHLLVAAVVVDCHRVASFDPALALNPTMKCKNTS